VNKTKDQYHHGDLRAALLGAAPGLIAEKGVEDFTLRGIARILGVTHGAVYRHFGDKRDFLVALSLEGHSMFEQELSNAIDEGKDLQTNIRSVALAYLRWALSHSSHYQIMFGQRLNEDGQYPELEDSIERAFAVVDRAFKLAGFSSQRRRNHSVALMTQLHGYCELVRLKRIRVKDQPATEQYLMKILKPFVNGICKDAT